MRALAISLGLALSACAMSVPAQPGEPCEPSTEAPVLVCAGHPTPCEQAGGTWECVGSGAPPQCDAGNQRCAPGDVLECVPAACAETP